jgi:hypothetical protein
LHEPGHNQKNPASTAFGFGMFLRHNEAHEKRPPVVNDEQQSHREFDRRLGLRTKVAAAPSDF